MSWKNQIDYILCRWRWRSSIQSAKTRHGADCGSHHQLFIAKFRLKLKKIGKTTVSFRYDLNQIPCDYTVEVMNIFKELDLIRYLKNYGWRFVTLYRNFGRNDAKAETPVLWPPHAKSWLIGKDSDAGRDWGQEEKGTTKNEMAGWHHWLDGRESGWTPGVGDGQGGLACCNSWSRKESGTTEQLNWLTDWQEVVTKTIPMKKKCKKAKSLSEGALQIAEKRREVKGRGVRERHTWLNTEFQRIARRDIEWTMQRNRGKQNGKVWRSLGKLEIPREHFMQRWAQ